MNPFRVRLDWRVCPTPSVRIPALLPLLAVAMLTIGPFLFQFLSLTPQLELHSSRQQNVQARSSRGCVPLVKGDWLSKSSLFSLDLEK